MFKNLYLLSSLMATQSSAMHFIQPKRPARSPARSILRKKSNNKYTPGGDAEKRNVAGTPVKNPKIAAHVNQMHEKWSKK